MIYTCYEMIRDCRANEARGWRYFVRQHVPVIRKLLARYGRGETHLQPLLKAVRGAESNLFQILEPAPERIFVAGLRQWVLTELDLPPAPIEWGLETVATALEPLTMVEKQ